MTPKTKKLYNLARKDDLFTSEMLLLDKKNKKPTFFSDNLDRCIYATSYYGWYVGRYGVEKARQLFPD